MFEKHRNSKPESLSNSVVEAQDAKPVSGIASSGGRSAVIGPGIHINGEISGDENLIIEGKVDGKVRLDNHLVDIGRSGRVKANITAKVIKIAGEVRGDLTSLEKVVISSTGNVHGNIVAPRMTLEDGAIFKGSIDMDPGEPAEPKTAPVAKSTAAKAGEKASNPKQAAASGKGKGNNAYSLNGG